MLTFTLRRLLLALPTLLFISLMIFLLVDLAPGLVHVVGGSHNSLLVEMSDHLVMVDAPVSDAQSLWVLSNAKQRFPGKPVRWVVLTHHHMDHAGGVRGALTDGGTLVVGQGAREHFRRVIHRVAKLVDCFPHVVTVTLTAGLVLICFHSLGLS